MQTFDRAVPNSRAARRVKAQPRWQEYIRRTCTNRAEVNKREAQLKYLRMHFSEWPVVVHIAKTHMISSISGE